MSDAHFWAMVGAILVCAALAAFLQWWWGNDQDPHSPDPRWQVVSWAKRLVGRETSHETEEVSDDDETDDDGDVEVHDWGYIVHSEGSTRVDLRPPPTEELTALEGWIRRELRRKTRTKDIVAGARKQFGASRATVYRAKRKVEGR